MSRVVSQLRRFSWLSISGCVALALSVAAHAQTFSITNVGNSANKASYPNMVVDKDGNLNLVWVDSVNGIMFARSSTTTTGTALGAAVPVTGSNGPALPAFQPQIAVDPTDTTVVAITWAALDPVSPAAGPPTYDVYAVRLTNKAGVWSETPASPAIVSLAGLPLADSPRLAWDNFGRVNIVWGQNAVWITQTADGSTFTAPVNLSATTPPTTINTGGPRVAVDAGSGEVVVAWTDIAQQSQSGSYCLLNPLPPDPTPITNTVGGNFWVNETLPVGAAYTFGTSNTRNLSNTDWLTGGDPRYKVGFFGCSFDNLDLFTDKSGHVNFLWSDESPVEDILTSKPTNGNPITNFSFPINLASLPATAPQVAVDTNGSFYVVWSGDGANSQGVFFTRSDDGGNNFTPSINIAPPSGVAPAYPQVAVDGKGDVYVAWEQVDPPISTSNTFDVFFTRSTDKGVTFPTVSQVSTNSSALCIPATPVQTTPSSTLCGAVQIGLDASSNPDMAWVNQVSGAAVADIDFATTNLQQSLTSDFTIAATQLSQTAQANQMVNFTVNTTAVGGFAGSIALGCTNFLSTSEASGGQSATSELTALTCSASPASISAGGSSTVSVVVPSDILSNAVFAQLSFEIAGTSTAGTTHKITVTVNIGNGPGSVTPASQSITGVGNSATFTVNVNPADFTGSLTFSCLDADTRGPLPAWLGCSFNPNPLPAGSFTTQLTLTEASTPTSSSLTSPPSPFAVPGLGSGFRIASAWTMALAGLAMMLTMFTLGRRQRLSAAVVLRGFLVMTLTIVLATALVSCGGSTSTPSTTTTSTGGTSGTGGTGSTGGSGGSGSGGSGGSGSSGGSSGGTGGGGGTGTGGGTVTPVQIHVSVLAQSSANTAVTLGTVTLTAQ